MTDEVLMMNRKVHGNTVSLTLTEGFFELRVNGLFVWSDEHRRDAEVRFRNICDALQFAQMPQGEPE